MTREDRVKEFHTTFGSVVDGEWTEELLTLRSVLVREEFVELQEAINNFLDSPYRGCEEHLLKEMADLQYVLSGTAVSLGLDLEEAFNRVHESNMSKAGKDGKAIYREDGKVLKGPLYREPYLTDLIEKDYN